MIELRNLKKTFYQNTINETVAIDNLSLKLNEGDFVTVIGGNGAGKSTLINLIAGTIELDDGYVLLNNIDVSRLSEYKKARYFGRVFQDPLMGTCADMTVLENLSLAKLRGKTRSLFKWSILKDDKEYFIEQLKSLDLGLEKKIHVKVGQLSGGQRQALTLLMATLNQSPTHRTILKDYVKFNNGNKEEAKIKVNNDYRLMKAEYLSSKKKIKENKELSFKKKRELIKEAYREFDNKFRVYDLTKPVLLLDEHTAALDPKTAKKVLELTEKIINEKKLTTIMITHNMADALRYGNRLIMMSKGKVVVDIPKEEKEKLTVKDLLDLFSDRSGSDAISDSAILG